MLYVLIYIFIEFLNNSKIIKIIAHVSIEIITSQINIILLARRSRLLEKNDSSANRNRVNSLLLRVLMRSFLAKKFYGFLAVRNRMNTVTSFRRNEFEVARKFARSSKNIIPISLGAESL